MTNSLGFRVLLTWFWLATSLASAQVLKDPALMVTEVGAGLNAPTAMAFIGPGDLLVLQKNDGQVRRVLDGVLQPGPVLDVAVNRLSERGLLGMALHPGFASTPWVYLYYTESSTGGDSQNPAEALGNRLYRYRWDGSALVEPQLLLDLPVAPGPNHDGGVLTFGPDGKLYAVIGDLNRRGQLQNVPAGPGSDDTSVILRLNDDGTTPDDNPFSDMGGNWARYYAYGIRNSFGLAFDPLTQKLWMTENGPDAYDEVNLVDPGFNSGWVPLMGPEARSSQGSDSLVQVPGSHYADPKFSWVDTVAPTAIVFLNSARLGAQYANDVFVGEVNTGTLYHFKLTPTRDGLHFVTPELAVDLVADAGNPGDNLEEIMFGTGFGGSFAGITDLKVGPDGRLYVLSIQGKIFAISQKPAILRGLVSDQATGAALQRVNVVAWSADPLPPTALHTRTDTAGTYVLQDLTPGRYWVFFSLQGYRRRVRLIELPPGEAALLDVQLTLR